MMENNYGGFWLRAVAFLIDIIILKFTSIVLLFIGIVALNSGFQSYEYDLSVNTFANITCKFVAIYYIMTVFLYAVYFTYFHGTTGQTIGKKIFGLKVLQSTGEPMTLGIAFLRWVGYIISGLILYLGYIWIAFDRKKQGWHDKIAGTCVIKVKP